jgi:hypothetical protein
VANTVTSHQLQPGQPWTFVHANGKRTFYVYEEQIVARSSDPKNPSIALDAMHSLLNPETDQLAKVSEKWLCEGPVGGAPRGYWLVGHVAELAEAA